MVARWPTAEAFKQRMRAEQKAARAANLGVELNYAVLHRQALTAMAREVGLPPEHVRRLRPVGGGRGEEGAAAPPACA